MRLSAQSFFFTYMNSPQVKPYGSWRSPITAQLIVEKAVGLGSVQTFGTDVYWLESRPSEKGRSVLVKQTADGAIADVTPPPFNVRTRVHEYGGGAYLATEEAVYFSNYSDGRVYQQRIDQTPEVLTPESACRYADFVWDQGRNRLICICEDHSQENTEPSNSIVAISVGTGEVTTLEQGKDFYSSPKISPDGNQLAYLSWDHPYMPWDSTYLWLATFGDDGKIHESKLIAGSETESICEPKWSPEGLLYFSSDRNDWWNIYCLDDQQTNLDCCHQMEAEFAYPHWVFGLSTYDFISDRQIICTYSQQGSWHLGTIDLDAHKFQAIATPYTNIGDVQTNSDGDALLIVGSPIQPTSLIKFGVATEQITILKKSRELNIDSGYISQPQAISFPTENNLTAHAWYYPPQNQDYLADSSELPPILVKSHGGPTAAASVNLNFKIQYWTSRGFGYLDVNYGGSIGYGREYRNRLQKNWGIVDVQDCINAAKYLVDQQLADGERLVISGGSAGGYTTLAALTFYDTFKAGASYYGVSDLEILAKDTHKFESRYLDGLIGAYPQDQEIYQERSPINYTDNLACPVIFFQGLEDKVVPPNQAEMMASAIKNKGLPVAYITFADEGHGFRQAPNIITALESEFYFYSRVFDFEIADPIQPIEIAN